MHSVNFALTVLRSSGYSTPPVPSLDGPPTLGSGHGAQPRVRDATRQRSSYSAEPPTAHHDQVRLELLGQGHDLQVDCPHPEVSPCHGAPSGFHPPGLFPEQLPGLLLDLLVEHAVVAERPG